MNEAAARRLGNAAGEAYANNFGESIESNMDVTRLAVQFDILDPSATTRDAQLVVEGLAGIADVLGEDVEPVARAVAQMLRTGLAGSAKQAFDILATGAREGVNIGGDLLETYNEFSTQFRQLGLDGPQALGLLSQGLRGGARDSDLVADALKELALRAKDPGMAEGFEAVGFSWDDLSRRIAQGGPEAAAALDETLDRIREMPDPAEQAAAAVALFGTQSEDMAAALLSMDLTTAVDELNGVTGSAQKMFDTLAGNDASKIEQAKRNIETAAQGIQGALAAAFSEPLGEFADWVSQNRGPLMQFLLDMANGALDFGDSVVESVASGTEALGEFVGSLSEVVYGLAAIPAALGQQDVSNAMVDMANGMLAFSEGAGDTADTIREDHGNAIDGARTKLNEFGEPLVALGFANDAALRTADAVAQVGLAADGTRFSIEGLDTANLRSTESGRALDDQLRASASSLDAEYQAALLAGESQENLQARYQGTRDALMGQLEAMGLSQEQAQALIDTVLETPETAYTVYTSNASAEADVVDRLTQKVVQLPDGNFIIVADTTGADNEVDDFIRRNSTKRINIAVGPGGQGGLVAGKASGGPIFGAGGPRDDLVPIMASNGEHMLTAAEVNAMGGHDAVYRFRRAALAGLLRLADGGPVNVPAIPDRHLAPAGSDEQHAYPGSAGGRRGPPGRASGGHRDTAPSLRGHGPEGRDAGRGPGDRAAAGRIVMEKSLANLAATATHELIELVRIFHDGDVERARRWIRYNSRKTRRKERDVLRGLAGILVADEHDDGFRELVIAPEDTAADVLGARIAVAVLNDDPDAVDALIEAWASWPAEARAEVLSGYVQRLAALTTGAPENIHNED
ncbi:phage tail tape measure protein [Microbacterium sp. 179-I 3D4 NHS]|uniref:phage tail tape measure protein n=1 Tax=Microbacterium sp. 179-I 3D4 NHS TaxID=3142381 RepID=UPI00399F779F